MSEFVRRNGRRLVVALALALALGGCAKDKTDEYVAGSVDSLYNQASDQLMQENYKSAAKLFDEVERQHPYSVWATRAQLMAAYAQYRDKKYDDAIISLGRFIQLHPGNRDVSYAYYLRALSYYAQMVDVKRDQSASRQSLKSLTELLRRYPNTRYSRDARRRVDMVRDQLAAAEMDRGRYYLIRNKHLAAINRFRTVVDKYQTSSQVPEALFRLVEAYTALGLTAEAHRAAAVLGYNYPSSDWYADAYALVKGKNVPPPKNKKSFWSWIF